MSRVTVRIDGVALMAEEGQTLASLLLAHGIASRRSVEGTPRAPWCGMGVCGECRVTVGGQHASLACLTGCTDGMVVRTGGGGR
jgi:predicted molibdopterin-dependent oxidoreductase YjgC